MDYLLRNLKDADLIRLDHGPLFTEIEQDHHGTIEFNWEEDGEPCQERIMLHDLRTQATIVGNRITVPNALGESLAIELFSLSPQHITLNLDTQALDSLIHQHVTKQPDLEPALIATLQNAVSDQIGGYRDIPEYHDDHPLHPHRLRDLHAASKEAAYLAHANLEAIAIDAIALTFGLHPGEVRQSIMKKHWAAGNGMNALI
ncbi:MAG: hypothetical protein AWU57_576 [Marinobacter sp. T13-3]|nr:MAG: hypothetical protein AWU57_576 [Marinobacter sp. T13-3]